MGEKKERIKTWMGACMIIVALCIDGIQILLTILLIGIFMGPVISAVASLGFWIWFKLLGVSFTKNPKNLAGMGGTAIIKIFLSFLPAFTAGIAAIVFLTRAEDKGGLLGKAAAMAQGKVSGVSGATQMGAPQPNLARQEGNVRRFQPSASSLNKGNTTNNSDRVVSLSKYKDESSEDRQKRLEERRRVWQEQEKQEKEMAVRKYGGQEKWNANLAESEKVFSKQQKAA